VIACLESMCNCGKGTTTAGEGYAMLAVLNGCDAFFKGCSSWVAESGVEMLAVFFNVLLSES